jgi:hypothetical protein
MHPIMALNVMSHCCQEHCSAVKCQFIKISVEADFSIAVENDTSYMLGQIHATDFFV